MINGKHFVSQVRELADLEILYPLTRKYSDQIEGRSEADEVYLELTRFIGREDHVVVIAATISGEAVGYAAGRLVDNYGETSVFVSQIYSNGAGIGSDLLDRLIEWGRDLGGNVIMGFVPLDQTESASRLWRAKPWKVMLRREI